MDDTIDKVSVQSLIEKEHLINLTPEVDAVHKYITIPDVNRPALQLAGFFDQFDAERVQIIGNVETAYLMTFDRPARRAKYAALTKYPMPCIIYARSIEPDSCMIEACRAAQIPLIQDVCEGGDNGLPAVLDPASPSGMAFMALAARVVTQVDRRNLEQPPTERVQTH